MGVCVALLCIFSFIGMSEGAAVGDSLQWAETTVLGLLKHWGSHHRLDTMNHDDRQRMWDCGCKANSTGFFHPILVTYGTGIGTSCVRAPDEDKPNWDPKCGASCSNHEGKRTAHFCPPGLRGLTASPRVRAYPPTMVRRARSPPACLFLLPRP